VSTSDTEASDSKAAARALARSRRREAERPDPGLLADQAMALLETLPGPLRVTCYASYGTEPDTGELRRRLSAAGYEVLLPRVRGQDLEWVVDSPDTTVSSMGISEPDGPAVELMPVRALLVPALNVTAEGDRLGKGGGFYDRVLAGLSQAPPVVAIVGDNDVVDDVPTQPHDERVHAIVTPTRVIHCARR
jgi:5-formyltetrahydrofolate cyclo-ligase